MFAFQSAVSRRYVERSTLGGVTRQSAASRPSHKVSLPVAAPDSAMIDVGPGVRRDLAWTGRPLRSALLLLGTISTAFAGCVVALLADQGHEQWVPVAAFCAIGLANIWIGILASVRRPHNRVGWLLGVTGLLILVAAAGNIPNRMLYIIGFVVGQGPIAAFLHVLLAFPSGRLHPVARTLVIVGYVITVGIDACRIFILPDGPFPASWTRPELNDALRTVQHALGATVLVIASMFLIGRLRKVWRRNDDRGERLALTAVYVWGIVMLAYFPASANLLAPAFGWSPVALFVAQLTPIAMMPFVFAAGILRGGFARSGQVEELGAWLGEHTPGRDVLQGAVAATLGDPSLTMMFAGPTGWLHTDGSPAPADFTNCLGVDPNAPFAVNGDGSDGGPERRFASPNRSGDRGLVAIPGSRGWVAAIDYDTTIIASRQLVLAAGKVAALALERDRLTAELLDEREHLRASRARLVEAAERERRRLAAELHDGLQARLVLAAMRAGTIATATATNPNRAVAAGTDAASTEGGDAPAFSRLDVHQAIDRLRADLNDSIADLRRLVQGMMPALLMERGLFAAAEDLLDRVPLTVDARFHEGDAATDIPPVMVSTCYFCLSEAISNTVKHANATRLQVRLVREPARLLLRVTDDGCGGATRPTTAIVGSGLVGLTERVEALGGTLTIDSPMGDGTIITVELPCAS
jgi:signal transduction histidine kinase